MRLSTAQQVRALGRIKGDVLTYNATHGAPAWLRTLNFDAVILHETLLAMRWSPWFEHLRPRFDWLKHIDALKIAFPQDEYGHAHVLDDWLSELGVSVVCTVLDDRHRHELYPSLADRAIFYETLTGYVDSESADRFRARMTPAETRPYDLVYRAKQHPYLYGSSGRLKYLIGLEAAARCPTHGLRCDISTRPHETVLGDAWLDFLGKGRATIGTESGSSVLDRRGEIKNAIEHVLAENPSATFEDVSDRMPAGWDDYRFLAASPRHFEAVVTKTAQVLVRGHYSGVLVPEEHYVPVEADFSNLDEALERVRDRADMARMAERAYEDVYLSGRYSYERLTDLVEQIMRLHARTPMSDRRRSRISQPARHLAAAHAEIERSVVAPATYAVLVGRRNFGEVAAGLRLVATDAAARRLVFSYLRSTYAREHVSPRVALVDLLCLGRLRRSQDGKADGQAPYRVSMEIDDDAQLITLRSVLPRSDTATYSGSPGANHLAKLLRDRAWEFQWDHSEVEGEPSYPIFGPRSTQLPLHHGRRALATLSCMARVDPNLVARAIRPVAETSR
jgi:hypothetical protein